LVNHFIAKYNREFSLKISNLSRDVMELFERYNWPGNVRELENIIERAFNLVENDTIEMNHLPHYLLEFGGIQGKEQKTVNLNKSLPALLESVEKEAIVDALERTGGNKLQSAKLLGISRAWLYKKIKQYQIE
jgi:transcriptional regulator with PAS, ATPase and Fis domain